MDQQLNDDAKWLLDQRLIVTPRDTALYWSGEPSLVIVELLQRYVGPESQGWPEADSLLYVRRKRPGEEEQVETDAPRHFLGTPPGGDRVLLVEVIGIDNRVLRQRQRVEGVIPSGTCLSSALHELCEEHGLTITTERRGLAGRDHVQIRVVLDEVE